jgi:hypothetical protein
MAINGTRNHIILAPNRKGLGEAILGVRLAYDLQSAGEGVFFLSHESNSKLVQDFPHLIFGSHASPLIPLYIENCIKECRASSLILSDYFTTGIFFDAARLDPRILTSFNIPVFAIDTWDSGKSPGRIDVFCDSAQPVITWPNQVTSLCPVPFLSPHSTNGAYRSLPERPQLTVRSRNDLRCSLGLEETSRTVLFCTAEWQHMQYESDAAIRLSAMLPTLIADYLSALGSSVHLVHVGPQPYNLKQQLNGHYHWLPPLKPKDFDELLASMDLVLSANISATTIAKAMVCCVPVLVLQNSVSGASREEVEAARGQAFSSRLEHWLDEVIPLFPFALWPVGYYRFLAPLLHDNPYVRAVRVAEVLDEHGVENALAGLLFNQVTREEQIHRQTMYLSQVQSLPTGAQVIQAALGD